MKARGGNARVGDVIPYIFCLAEGEEPAKTAQADRAKHPDEIRKPGSGLKIGNFYALFLHLDGRINNSIQTSSTTLETKYCHQLSGFVSLSKELIVRDLRSVLVGILKNLTFLLFTCIPSGLDPGRYRNSVAGAAEVSFSSLDSRISDTERFKDADPFLVRCRSCQGQLPFMPIHDRNVCALPFSLLACCVLRLVDLSRQSFSARDLHVFHARNR